jgi:hypothetical protein
VRRGADAQAILDRDAAKLGGALSATMAAWGVMLPYTTDPYLGKDAAKSAQLAEFVASYDRPHTHGCLFSGAGGGFLMVVSDTPVANGMALTINHKSPCLPYTSNTMREAREAPKAAPLPAQPPWGVSSPWQFDIDGRPFPQTTPTAAKIAAAALAAAALAVGVALGKKLK